MQLFSYNESDLNEAIERAVKAALAHVTQPAPYIMTKRQLADYVQKPLSTINRWMDQGMPYRKEGKEYPTFCKPLVDEWLEERFGEKPVELRRVA